MTSQLEQPPTPTADPDALPSDDAARRLRRWPECPAASPGTRAASPLRRPALRCLPPLPIQPESPWRRGLYVVVAGLVLAGFVYLAQGFWAPAHPGVDQNGYLVGGKMLAQRFSPGLKPAEPYAFVGWMWIRTDDGWYYPKYPIGLPLLNAVALWLDPAPGDPRGKIWVMLISPICSALALVAMFLLVRIVAGSFLAVLGMILLATSMTTLAVANSPWSHAPALAFVTWGMFLLIRWWQTATLWRGALAGLLLGYAVTIRYTEGLLVLPILLVLVTMIRWREPRSYLRAAAPLLAWLVPVAALIAFNRLLMGAWTGYDATNESTGFTWDHFKDKWEFMLQQIYDHGLFFVVPLAALGFVLLYRASWRLGALLTLWFVPGLVLYTAYYWGLGRGGIGYLRFFLTLFPAMIVAACWCMRAASAVAGQPLHPRGSVATPIACGVIVALASMVGVRSALPALDRDHASNANLADLSDHIVHNVPRGSVLFVQQSGGGGGVHQFMNFLQFKGDYDLYSADAFSTRGPGLRAAIMGGDDDAPTPLQPARRRFVQEQVYHGKLDVDLIREQNRIIAEAIQRRQRAFVLSPAPMRRTFESRFIRGSGYALHEVATWHPIATVPSEPAVSPLQPQPRGPAAGGPGGFRPPRGAGAPRSAAAPAWQILEILPVPGAPSSPAS